MYNLIVVGAGPAGYHAALTAARRGKQVLLVCGDDPGGTCLNRGCIPTKAFLSGSYHTFEELQKQSRRAVAFLRDGLSALLEHPCITLHTGRARCVESRDPAVMIDGTLHRAENVLIATGAEPRPLPVSPENFNGPVLTREYFDLPRLPRRVVICGASFSGIELARIYTSLKVSVTLLEAREEIASCAERSFAREIRRNLVRSGAVVQTGAVLTGFAGTAVCFTQQGEEKECAADAFIWCGGRRPNIEFLRPEAAGVVCAEGAICVDRSMKTTNPAFYAVGDVTGIGTAHGAYRQAEAAIGSICGRPAPFDPLVIPEMLYGEPEYFSVGLKKRDLCPDNTAYRCIDVPLRSNPRAAAEEAHPVGRVRVVMEKDCVAGVQMLGRNISELAAAASLMVAQKSSVEDIRQAVFPHPTRAESLKEAIIREDYRR
ncbi:MAG: dihydrolipoyl dehydrogenase family protein [Fibrobacterota bacterium]